MEFKRCFVALDLSREAINEIKRIQELIKKQNLFTGRFTEPENLHLTIKFLGEIEEEKIEKVKEKLKTLRFPSFEAEIGEVGVFSKNFIKIIWVHLIGAEKLQQEIDKILKDIFEEEQRFMSHITIARVRYVGDKNALLDYLESVKPEKIKFKVEKFFLKDSQLFPEGPVYSDIDEYKLGEKK